LDDPLLTVREVAQRLRVSDKTIRRWIRIGRIRPVKKFSNRAGYRIPQSELARLMEPEHD
jgi:excisionase family DNA binding protein